MLDSLSEINDILDEFEEKLTNNFIDDCISLDNQFKQSMSNYISQVGDKQFDELDKVMSKYQSLIQQVAENKKYSAKEVLTLRKNSASINAYKNFKK